MSELHCDILSLLTGPSEISDQAVHTVFTIKRYRDHCLIASAALSQQMTKETIRQVLSTLSPGSTENTIGLGLQTALQEYAAAEQCSFNVGRLILTSTLYTERLR